MAPGCTQLKYFDECDASDTWPHISHITVRQGGLTNRGRGSCWQADELAAAGSGRWGASDQHSGVSMGRKGWMSLCVPMSGKVTKIAGLIWYFTTRTVRALL